MTPEGEGHHEQTQAQSLGRERGVPGEEGEEITSPKRKVIRVESEETQDYVRESLDLSRDEAEEIQGGALASGPPGHPKSGVGPLLAFFRPEWALLGGLGFELSTREQNFEPLSWFGLSFWGKKKGKV